MFSFMAPAVGNRIFFNNWIALLAFCKMLPGSYPRLWEADGKCIDNLGFAPCKCSFVFNFIHWSYPYLCVGWMALLNYIIIKCKYCNSENSGIENEKWKNQQPKSLHSWPNSKSRTLIQNTKHTEIYFLKVSYCCTINMLLVCPPVGLIVSWSCPGWDAPATFYKAFSP